MIVYTRDMILVELQHSDAAHPPDAVGGLNLNSSCVWYRTSTDDGAWKRSSERSILMTKAIVESSLSNELDRKIGT